MNYIYGLFCPISETIRYVGKSDDPCRRLREHMESCVRNTHHAARWLSGLKSKGMTPSVVVLAELSDSEDWQEVERRFIASAESFGWRLTNSTEGGEGCVFLRAEDKAAWLERVTESLSGAEVREKISAGVRNAYKNPETREKAVNRQRNRWKDPTYRAHLCNVMYKTMSTPENKRKASAMGKESMAQPGAKEAVSQRLKAYYSTEEGRISRRIFSEDPRRREAHRLGQIKNWKDPEYRARQLAAKRTPEVIQIQKEKARQQWADPEIRARMSAAIKAAAARKKQAKSNGP